MPIKLFDPQPVVVEPKPPPYDPLAPPTSWMPTPVMPPFADSEAAFDVKEHVVAVSGYASPGGKDPRWSEGSGGCGVVPGVAPSEGTMQVDPEGFEVVDADPFRTVR